MENFLTTLAEINDKINAFIWVKIGLVLLIGTGILMTCCTKWFQISHIGYLSLIHISEPTRRS